MKQHQRLLKGRICKKKSTKREIDLHNTSLYIGMIHAVDCSDFSLTGAWDDNSKLDIHACDQ